VEASLAVGVSWPVGTRWFRHAGGMPPISLVEPSGRCLTFAEREEIASLHGKDAKLVMNDRLREHVQERLNGTVRQRKGRPAGRPFRRLVSRRG
jgi:hypothetical protein